LVGPWIHYLEIIGEEEELSDIQFLGQLEFAGELVDLISSEFSANAAQISFVPASGKTFYHVKSKLYPVVDTIKTGIAANNTVVTSNRRADVELAFDGTLKDVLTHDMESTQGQGTVTNAPAGQGNAGETGQYETNNHESMDGDAIKAITLTSTNTSGTYRVQLEGYIKDTGTSP
jgi:hypothetical protein